MATEVEPNRRPIEVPVHLAVRDAVVVALTYASFVAYRANESAAPLVSVPLALVFGVLTALSGFLVHEWGHLVGAWIGRSRISHPTTIRSIFLFKFEDDVNDRRQFFLMANGGFLASALVTGALVVALSPSRLGDAIALGLSALGVLATLVLELPPVFKVLRGEAVPPDLVKLPKP